MKFMETLKRGISTRAKKRKIEAGAKDFAIRFKDVMRDLANG